MAFAYNYALQIHHGFLLKDHLPRTKAFDVTVWSIMDKG